MSRKKDIFRSGWHGGYLVDSYFLHSTLFFFTDTVVVCQQILTKVSLGGRNYDH